MDKSYFIYRLEAKEKIKRNFEKINYYEKSLHKMESSPNHQNIIHTIKFLKKYLSEIKKEVKIEVDIICHG